MVKIGDFDFEIELSISLAEARPMCWDKTDDTDSNVTKKGLTAVSICLQEDFEAVGYIKITLVRIAAIY